jgi:hypothetical protein
VQRALQVRSLDAPLGGDDGEGPCTLLDQLVAASAGATSPGDVPTGRETVFDARWLRTQLGRLGSQEQRLLLGHWIEGLGWCELALELQLSSHQARQRGEALLASLQENAIASSAAIAV